METLAITLEERTLKGRKTDALRREDIVPAVVYGFETEPASVQMNRGDFTRLYRKSGTSSVVEIEIGGKKLNALIQEIQKHPVTDFVTHVDFLTVDMNKKVEAEIRISLIGESQAVKSGGILLQSMDAIEVSALPDKLIKEVEVDISSLKEFGDHLTVADITAPEGVEILVDSTAVIATVQAPRTSEEMEALDAPVEDGVADQQEEVDAAKKDEASEEKEA